ncbi:hypothetical protein [Chitinophaga hostae]|uniref:SWIM-type domain-containing protein n=1 Tax=Chitinophaga hostae TaxID=2831022 RepID=A0ABS5IVV1_9BACT|nr:hypothetical protein [Chitinophaga hostae]MBS0027084.1 hypothetical protein [Chitinophaga hostae]
MSTAKLNTHAPSASVAIPFTNGNCISLEELQKQSIDGLLLKDIAHPLVKFQAYKNHQLVLKSKFATGDYILTFNADSKDLHVACSCKNKAPGICIHIFKTIDAIAYKYGNKYFEQLQENKQFDIGFKYPDAYDKIETDYGITLAKRKELKQLYPFENTSWPLPLSDMLALEPAIESVAREKRAAVVFFVALPYGKRQFPFILSGYGKLSKGNDQLVSWVKFGPEIDEAIGRPYTVDQLGLYLKAGELRKKVEEFAKKYGDVYRISWNLEVQEIFQEWKILYPLLQDEIFVYAYKYYGSRQLRGRPSKANARRVAISKKKPFVYFKKDSIKGKSQLSLGIKIDRKPISSYRVHFPFLFHNGTMYMFDSYQDAVIVQWIDNIGCITFFAEHKKDFDDAILTPLSQKYPIL